MSDTPHRPVPPPALGELVETAPPGLAPPGSEQTTLANARPGTPTQSDLPLIAGYEIEQKIGEGGMGAVYRAKKVMLGRTVALKTMRSEVAAVPGNRERFLREARAAALVEHPNIVQIHHVEVAPDGTPFIELEFLKGEPLDVRMKREPVSPLALILKVAREVADGLEAAHTAGPVHRDAGPERPAGLVHRDIKPANVWLEGDPATVGRHFRRCKILDFGLARLAGKEDVELTAAGAVLGTPAYMSPEQARGHAVDFRTDLFSLGVMLYRMATGEPPFAGATATDVMFAVVNDAPRPVRARAADLPPALLDLIEQLMSKNPAGRPSSAAVVSATASAIERSVTATNPDSLTLRRSPLPPTDASTAAFRPPPPETAVRAARDRFTELAGAIGLMPLVAAAHAGGWFAAAPWATWPHAARAFLLATALAWAVAVACLIPARGGWARWVQYAFQFALGIAVAPLALWADGWSAPAGAARPGVQYGLYFGLAVCAGRWWWERLCDVASGRPAPGPARLTWWRRFAAPLVLGALVVVWPSQHAPAELAAVVVAAAVAAQVARPLSRVRA